MHRSGRTGRAGKSGVSIVLYSSRTEYLLQQLERNAVSIMLFVYLPNFPSYVFDNLSVSYLDTNLSCQLI